MWCFSEVFQQIMTWITFPVITEALAKFSIPFLFQWKTFMPKQMRETTFEGGEGREATRVFMNRLSWCCVFRKCFNKLWPGLKVQRKARYLDLLQPLPLFSPVIMNQVGLVTKLTVNNTLMLNSQQRWSSIVNHNGVCPSGHGQGIVWSELLWYLATDPSCAARHEREKERVYN